MNKYQWLTVAHAALVNAGCSPSGADEILSREFDPRDREETKTPTPADWESAYQAGGARLDPMTQRSAP